MKKENKNTVVPALRFPEFREDWSEKPLNKLGETINGLSGKSASDFGSGKPYVTYKQVFDRAWIDFERCEKVNVLEGENQNELQQGDILFTTSSETPNEVGYASVILNAPPKPLYLNSFCFAFRPFDLENLVPEFSQYLFHSPIYRKAIGILAQGSTRFNISKGAFLNLKIPIPKEAEQKKLATFLTTLDTLLAAESEKLRALQAHKKGLMQVLFPAAGETVPRVRFGECLGNGEWEIRQLDEFITERSQFPTEKLSLYSLTIEDGVTPKTERYERSFLVRDEEAAYKVVCPNDFAFNPMNLRFGAIGRHSGKGNVAVSKYYNIFHCDNSVDSRFCEFYFKSAGMIAYYDDVATGSLIEKRRVHFSDFLKFNIRFPKLKEQQKIATCLTALDALLTAQHEKLAALKRWKAGLMQRVFPKPNNEEI